MTKTAVWTDVDVYLVATRAYDFAMQGRYKEAVVLFDGLLAVAPGNLYVRRSLAAVHLKNGNPLEALSVLDQAQLATPTPNHRRLRLDVLIELEWWAEADQEFAVLKVYLDYQQRNRYAALLQKRNSLPDSTQPL